jgi:hypothetical protein
VPMKPPSKTSPLFCQSKHAPMAYAESRATVVALTSTPSLLFNNLAASPLNVVRKRCPKR